jgi:hypothetical protein
MHSGNISIVMQTNGIVEGVYHTSDILSSVNIVVTRNVIPQNHWVRGLLSITRNSKTQNL